jgi:hypothetical protein
MRLTALIVVAVLVCGGAAVFAAFAVQDSSPPAQAASPGAPAAAAIGNQRATTPDGKATAQTVRALDHEHPLRLWIGGDSLAGGLGFALGDMVGETGVTQALVDYKVSSGLASNDVRNWYSYASQQMETANPEAIVFIIGTNDWPAVSRLDANNDGVADWTVAYRSQIDRMMELFIGKSHRTVYWLGAPTLGTHAMDSAAVEIDKVMREEAEKHAPDVVYIDTYRLFSSSDGTYSRQILDENGKVITARISDGVHFTLDGAAYLARQVFKLLDAEWHLTKQADTEHPIAWTLSQNSSESIPGYSSTPRSRYRRNSSSSSNSNSGSNSGSNSNYTPPTSPSVTYVTPTFGGTVGATTPVVTSPPGTSPPATSPQHATPTTKG